MDIVTDNGAVIATLEARIKELEAALGSIRDAMPGTDDAADRVQRLISKALQEQGE
jgi:prefoldin subunit 5